MNRDDKIKQEVQKTIDCFDQFESVKTDAFFYTRLKARMEEDAKKSKGFSIQLGWNVLAPAVIVAILVLNIYTVSIFFKSQKTTDTESQDLVTLFTSELTLDASQYNPTYMLNE